MAGLIMMAKINSNSIHVYNGFIGHKSNTGLLMALKTNARPWFPSLGHN